MNRFPINGLNPGGCKNSQQIALVPESIRKNKGDCNGKTLAVEEDLAGSPPKGARLIAKDANDCDLDGATFSVKRMDGKEFEIEIHVLPGHFSSRTGGKTYPGYVFTLPHQETSLCKCSEKKGKCTEADFVAFQQALGIKNDLPFWERKHSRDDVEFVLDAGTIETADTWDPDDIAIIIPSEVHGEDGSTFVDSEQKGWFNIACSGDALAKADLYQIQPHMKDPTGGPPKYYQQRDTALKLITANYCDQDRYTFKGNEIEWDFRDKNGNWPKQPSDRFFEAVWNEHGAVCVSNSRLYHTSTIAFIPNWIYPDDCYNKKTCDDENGFQAALKKVCPGVRPCKLDQNGYLTEGEGYLVSRSH
ncbi:MAG TPA: ADYC domain-containing protein [Kofleriaceae bacterium]